MVDCLHRGLWPFLLLHTLLWQGDIQLFLSKDGDYFSKTWIGLALWLVWAARIWQTEQWVIFEPVLQEAFMLPLSLLRGHVNGPRLSYQTMWYIHSYSRGPRWHPANLQTQSHSAVLPSAWGAPGTRIAQRSPV